MILITGPPDGAGQYPGGSETSFALHQHLRGGSNQTVDQIGPALGVVLRQPGGNPSQVDVVVGEGQQVPSEHHLLQLSVADAAYGLSDNGLPLRSAQPAITEGDVPRPLGWDWPAGFDSIPSGGPNLGNP